MTAEEKIKRIDVLMNEVCELGAELLISGDNPLGKDELATRINIFISDIAKSLTDRAVAKMFEKWPDHMEKEREEAKKQEVMNVLPSDPDRRLN